VGRRRLHLLPHLLSLLPLRRVCWHHSFFTFKTYRKEHTPAPFFFLPAAVTCCSLPTLHRGLWRRSRRH